MPKYLIQASYTHEGFEGVRTKGGSSRRAAVAETAKSLGGKLEAFYFAFGDHDAVVILDLPDNEAAAAAALAVDAAGGASTTTTVYPRAGRRRCKALDRLRRLPPAGDLTRRVVARRLPTGFVSLSVDKWVGVRRKARSRCCVPACSRRQHVRESPLRTMAERVVGHLGDARFHRGSGSPRRACEPNGARPACKRRRRRAIRAASPRLSRSVINHGIAPPCQAASPASWGARGVRGGIEDAHQARFVGPQGGAEARRATPLLPAEGARGVAVCGGRSADG
jgi:uncharacterized protein with GYD domain